MDTIEGMRVFVAVAAERSFTAGAARAGISPKLASKYVGQLEARLGAQLLNRTTRSVTLTDTGAAYYERCLTLLADFDEVEAVIHESHGDPKGRIRMTAPTSFGEADLTQALVPFLNAHSKIKVELNLTDRHVSLVEEGFDLGIRISSLDDSSLIARKLAPMRVAVCASPEYLAQAGTPDHPNALATHRCIVDTNFRNAPHWPFLIEGERTSVKVDGPFFANTPRATCEMVAAGVGIGMVPLYVAGPFIREGRIVTLMDSYTAFDFGVYAIYPPNRHLTPRVRALVDHLADWFAEHGAY